MKTSSRGFTHYHFADNQLIDEFTTIRSMSLAADPNPLPTTRSSAPPSTGTLPCTTVWTKGGGTGLMRSGNWNVFVTLPSTIETRTSTLVHSAGCTTPVHRRVVCDRTTISAHDSLPIETEASKSPENPTPRRVKSFDIDPLEGRTLAGETDWTTGSAVAYDTAPELD